MNGIVLSFVKKKKTVEKKFWKQLNWLVVSLSRSVERSIPRPEWNLRNAGYK